MSYEKIILTESTGARERCMENTKAAPETRPSPLWVTKLLERQEAGEILTASQLEMIRRATQ